MLNRYLLIGADGIARSEIQSSGDAPASEIFRCDCQGLGVALWSEQSQPGVSTSDDAPCAHCGKMKDDADVHTDDGLRGHVFVPAETRPQTLDEWKAEHEKHGYYRTFFVNVTYRPKASLGMRYDEATDTFSEVPKEDVAAATSKG